MTAIDPFTRRVLDRASGYLGILDVHGNVLLVNSASLESADLALSDVVGRKFWECPWWSASDAVRARLEDACRRAGEGEVVCFETSARTAGDETPVVQFQVAPLRDEGGRITHLVPSAFDVTALKETVEAMRESEARFRSMADGLPLIVWVHDAEGEQQFVNRTFSEFFEVDAEEMRGGRWKLLLHPDDEAEYIAEFLACTRERRPFHAEARVKRGDRGWCWIESWGRPRFSPQGMYLGFVGCSADVTSRKLAEARMRESEARYRELVQSANSAIVRWNRDGTLTFFNEYAERLFGYRAEEVVGRHVGILLPDRDSRGRDISELVAGIVEDPEHYREMANENVTRDGWRVWMLWTNRPVYGNGGRVEEILSVGSDITELKAAEHALKEADRRKDRFMATLAHELRNPLAPIQSGLDVLRRRAGDPEAATRVLEMMDRQVSHMVRLVEDLMDLSRINRGKIELRRQVFDLNHAIHGAVEISRSSTRLASRRLDVDLPEEEIVVHADPVRIVQVVANLVGNAVKFTGDEGRIRVSAKRSDAGVLVSVRDDGVGIPPDMLEGVFEMFTQVAGASAVGLGVGLTLARDLVELHGGTVEARSEGPGRGSEFVVRMPILRGGPGPEPTPESGAESIPAGLRVLVVDDNRDAADSLGMLLSTFGAEVLVVHGGREALEACEGGFRPAVAFVDIGMPGMDGYEVARRMRDRDEDIRLVAVTGWGQEEDRRRVAEAGFERHLTKPVRVVSLTETLSLPGGGPHLNGG